MPYLAFLAGENLTAEKLNSRIVEEVLEWTPLANLGVFASGMTANPAKAPRLRVLKVLGSEVWLLEGRINTAGGTLVNTTQTLFTFNTPWRPTVEHGTHVYAATSSHYPVRLGLMVSGALTGSVPSAATTPSTVWLDNVSFTNPVF
ncbi:hypothetical protein ACFCZV_13130 [Streptomyces hydrogenans]|uniref:hypothetical protein n=1 Tax=Streptomyces hydrogenans TaxID=1873719 RepID=UPI0035D72732